jgi:uncharacterized protein YbaR (Trm112 family)
MGIIFLREDKEIVVGNPDADKPVARLELDTRAMGPMVCEECEKTYPDDPEEFELENVLLMEDGGVCCPNCKSHLPAFEQFSNVITSAAPVKLKGATHVCTDRCRERGCPYRHPEIDEDEE